MPVLSLRFAALTISRRTRISTAAFALAVIAGWLYWNWPRRVDMAAYVPADAVAFVESDDLVEMAAGIGSSEAWTKLAAPLGARASLLPNPWLIRLARWTGIGSTDAVLIARSQMALVFTGAEASQADTTLTIRPLTTLVIETQTTQRRMRLILENHLEEFARRRYGKPTSVRKQIDGVDLIEWLPSAGSGLVAAFVDTAMIVGNDEASVVRCVDVRRGKLLSLAGNKQLEDLHRRVGIGASLFGFLSKAGVKPLLTAWVLSRGRSDPNAPTAARIFSDTFGNLVDGFACGSRFAEGGAEDRCFLSLSEGVADRLRSAVIPGSMPTADMTLVPPDTQSVSVYHFQDVDGLWRELNAVVSSHADVLGAIAARPLLRSLLKPYGIDDPDAFAHSVGTTMAMVRLEEGATSVLVTEAFDRQSLRKLVELRLGSAARTETVGDAELMLSASDNFAASFVDSHLLTGTGDAIRRCLQARAQSQSLASVDAYRRSLRLLDNSLPIIALTFTDDRRAAISFVELFSTSERSAFSSNASSIDQASRSLPYAVGVTLLKENGFEWTSRSSFGAFGSLATVFAPGSTR
jgi:hypothetical protein